MHERFVHLGVALVAELLDALVEGADAVEQLARDLDDRSVQSLQVALDAVDDTPGAKAPRADLKLRSDLVQMPTNTAL